MVLIFSTAPDHKSAQKIARNLIDKKLAACVSISAEILSIYRWKGKIEKAKERLLLIKAPKKNFKKIEKEIVAVHPYEIPEIIGLSVTAAYPPYLGWLSASVR